MFATFILVQFYRYDRVTVSLWIRYPVILLGEGLQLAYVCLPTNDWGDGLVMWLHGGDEWRLIMPVT
jgi:hypothetical protein